MHEFRQIEDAVTEKLEGLKLIGVRTLETYSEQFDVEEMTELTIRFPCIYVSAGPLKVTRKNNLDECIMDLVIIAGDKNLRGSAAAMRGDATSPGVYGILLESRNLLHRKKLISSWGPAQLTSEFALLYEQKKDVCLYMATYELKKLGNL